MYVPQSVSKVIPVSVFIPSCHEHELVQNHKKETRDLYCHGPVQMNQTDVLFDLMLLLMLQSEQLNETGR